jgi:hypothetical protein
MEKSTPFFEFIGYNNGLLAIFCHVVYATLGLLLSRLLRMRFAEVRRRAGNSDDFKNSMIGAVS